MQKIIIIIAALIFTKAHAQTFITHGKIEFEKTVNQHAMLDDNNSWEQTLKKTVPKNRLTYFDLYFNGDKTLYKPGKDVVQTGPDWMVGPASDNTVFTDLTAQQLTSQKTVFENTYLIQDSLRNAQWKLTNDTRTIAGFECRKATTIIMDSVYVFAFYTDEILTSGGPESFNGLPGMILGIAIPRMHTTWFATKLQLTEIKPEALTAPKKGKKTNSLNLKTLLQDVMKEWGKYGQRNQWNIFV